MAARPRAALISVALVAVLFLIGGALPVRAAGVAAPKLGIRLIDTTEAYVKLTMRPGETRQVHLELGNYSQTRVSARSYVADVYSMINGGMGVRLSGEAASGTTEWLTYPAKTLVLGPLQAMPETMTVAVPWTAAPGDYLSSLVIEGDAGTSQAGDAAFKQVDRQAVAVAIRVPGPLVPGLSLPTAVLRTTPGGVSYIDLGVVNSGNIHLHLAGTYALADASGAQIAAGPVEMDTVYAHTSTVLAAPLTMALAPGHYTVLLTLSDPNAPVSASSGPLPIDIAAPVAPPMPAAPQSPSPSLDLMPLIAGTLGIGLALGAVFAAAAYLVIRRSRRQQPSTTSAES
jgi:hypothetical protein